MASDFPWKICFNWLLREDFMALIAPSISEGLGLQLSKFSSESGFSHHSDYDAAGGVRCRTVASRPLFKMRQNKAAYVHT